MHRAVAWGLAGERSKQPLMPMSGPPPPHLRFVDATLPDGRLAVRSRHPRAQATYPACVAVPDAMRLALFVAWYQKCAWCHRALSYDEMEIDHLIPQSFSGPTLEKALRLHGLPADFDLQDPKNLVPACGRCNGIHGDRPPPDTPAVSMLFAKSEGLAARVAEAAEGFMADRRIQMSLAAIGAKVQGTDVEPLFAAFAEALAGAKSVVEAAAPGTSAINVDPAHHIVLQPGRWNVVGKWSDQVITVADATGRGGYTGPSSNFALLSALFATVVCKH